ncbi:MAG TPA: hypothetical protein VIF09_13140 [Polyangiaceae bacterium]
MSDTRGRRGWRGGAYAGWAVAMILLGACGGKTSGQAAGVAGDAGGSDASTPTDGGSTGTDASAVCVEVAPESFVLTCQQDSDCTGVTTGTVCSGSCDCGGNTAINQSSLAAYQAAISSIQLSTCPCPQGGVPRCVTGQCALCGVPGICPDAGITPPADASAADADASACVTVVASSFGDSCNKASDCVYVTMGTLCPGDCNCGNTFIDTSSEVAYQDAVSSIQFGSCPCAAAPAAVCKAGVCAAAVTPP